MPKAEYPYVSVTIPPSEPFPQGQIVWRPLVLAKISAATGKKLKCIVCLDTGADACVLPSAFAAALGLDLLKMPKQFTAGVGSSANATYYYDGLAIDLGQGIEFKAHVGFMPAMDQQGIGLLGQYGFFEYYVAGFFHSQKKFTSETI